MAIRFFSETKSFQFKNKRKISTWLKNVILSYQKCSGQISVIFCSDEQILEINKAYLKHFYFTDVITFNYNENNIINGDIYISIDRVIENACKYNVNVDHELNRVIVHGVLHLLGFNDTTKVEKEKMRLLEDVHLKKCIEN